MALTDFWEWVPNSYSIQILTKTDVIEFSSGTEHRRRRWRLPRYVYAYLYDETRADLILMRQFFNNRGGQYDEFYVIVPEPTTQRFTAADDLTLTLSNATVPSTENVWVKVDDVYQASSTYSLDRDTKVLTFTVAVTGAVDVSWYECAKVRFLPESLLRDMVMNVMGSMTVQFITLKSGLPYSG